ncbi:putative P450 monooxygenase [Teratosphaeria nubilosa]|uniref:Putative P450 monooxygenase n=1 Tax=Teratosphaeria nubilosa TaxID=161662 RepID=A0A6G1L8F3_9PEZI|nr:putative P450 monooxygenase [Teratosphaeria nubilosa]
MVGIAHVGKMNDIARLPVLLALVGGIGSHVLYFNRYECHMHGFRYLFIFMVASVGIGFTLINGHHYSLVRAAAATFLIGSSFLVGALGSTLIYRIFINPLNKFPGPWPARLSNLYMSFQLGKSDAYYKLQALHRQYGPIVRIGSNDLSIIDAGIMETVYGQQSKVTKSHWYDIDAPLTSMHTSRDRTLHDKRRRVWAPAFSDKALREYERTIDASNDKVVQRVREAEGKAFNATKWFSLYSFEVMGKLAFGKDYGMLDSGEKQESLEMLSEGMQPFGYLLPIWFSRLLTQIPGLGSGYQKFVRFCVQELDWRVNRADEADKKGRTDIMSSILKAYKGMDKPQKEPMLQADARLIIVAGSDTTAATFAYLFYHLARDPQQVKKLREELTPLAQGQWSDKDIRQAQLLNGAINEALRLHPPVPSGLSRLTPREGMQVGAQWVPGRTNFIMPQFVIGRDESVYERANDFVPERWCSKPTMVKSRDAFAPFSVGPYGCIGKNLALMELRTLTARLVLAYDVKLAPDEDGHRLLYETLDHFTLSLGDLDLVFTKAAA